MVINILKIIRNFYALTSNNDAIEIAPLFCVDNIFSIDILGYICVVENSKVNHGLVPCAVHETDTSVLQQEFNFRFFMVTKGFTP